MNPDALSRALAMRFEPISTLCDPSSKISIVDEPKPSPLGWWIAVAYYCDGDEAEWQPRSHREPDRVVWCLKRLLTQTQFVFLFGEDEIEVTPTEDACLAGYRGFVIPLSAETMADDFALALARVEGLEVER